MDINGETHKEKALRREFREWLSFQDPQVSHNKACDIRHKDTGRWFVEGDQFIEWKRNPRSFMWIHGPPGHGKSILCSTIVEAINAVCEDDLSLAMAYFYFDFKDAEKQNPRNLICSLILQLSLRFPRPPFALVRLHTQNRDELQRPGRHALLKVLKELSGSFTHTYIVLDALDECMGQNRTEILDFIKVLVSWGLDNIHFLVASQREVDIQNELESLPVACDQVNLVTQAVGRDIQIYIHDFLALEGKDGLGKWGNWGKELIEETLVAKVDRMFLWVSLQLKELRHCASSKNALLRALSELPETLGETYKRILTKIHKKDRRSLLQILQWLAFAERPITLQELAAIRAVDIKGESPYNPYKKPERPEDVLIWCSGLVTLDSDKVQLSHLSVKEYLIPEQIRTRSDVRHFSLNANTAHTFITHTCLVTLLQLDKPDNLSSTIEDSPLVKYAAKYWINHFSAMDTAHADALQKSIKKLFTPQSPQYFNWICVYDIDNDRNSYQLQRQLSDIPSPLYYASLVGLRRIVIWLLDKGEDIHAQGGVYGSAIQVASARGHEAVVQLLPGNGADVDAQEGQDGTALQAASAGGHVGVVRLLLGAEADVDAQEGRYGTALHAASARGHEAIVGLPLENGVDVNVQGGLNGAPRSKRRRLMATKQS